MKTVLAASLDFASGIKVLNRSKRFILPVPNLGKYGDLLIYPVGSPKAGQPIKDEGDRGLIFYNGKDQVWQAARGNGLECVVINDLTPERASDLRSELLTYVNDPEELRISSLRALLIYATVKFKHVDFYPKKRNEILGAHRPYSADLMLPTFGGYMEVNKDTVHEAVWVREPFIFTEGPVTQTYPEGGIVVKAGSHAWGIESGVFIRNFVYSDGNESPLVSLEDAFDA